MHTQGMVMYSCFLFFLNRRGNWIIINIIIPIALRPDPWPWRPPFTSSSHSCLAPCPPVFPIEQFDGIYPHFAFHLYHGFPVSLLPPKLFFHYSFRDSFCRIPLLLAQPTLISLHACTLPGQYVWSQSVHLLILLLIYIYIYIYIYITININSLYLTVQFISLDLPIEQTIWSLYSD